MITVVVGPFGFSLWTPKILQHMFWCPPQYYSNHLNTGQVWYLNDRIVSGCQMVRYLNGGLKTGLKKILLMVKMSSFELFAKSRDNHLNTG